MDQNFFTVRGRLPSLNDYVDACRAHWSKGAALKKETEELIFWSIKDAVGKKTCRPVQKPVRVLFVWYEHGLKRDMDNIFSAKKYILDAMQTAGIIESDDRKHVVGLGDFIIQTTKGNDRVVVYIWEDDDT